jgi:cell division septum initiation protein DivIVA
VSSGTINILLNVLSLLLGGGALVGVLRYLNNRQTIRNADTADIRDHYAEEVEQLRGQLIGLEKHYREMLSSSDKRHAECEDARTEMRARVSDLESQVKGLEAQIRQYSADSVLKLAGQQPSEQVVAAAHRVKDITENGNGAK